MRDVKCYDLLLEPVVVAVDKVKNVNVARSSDVVDLVNACYNLGKSNREKAIVVGLNANGGVTGMHQVSSGLISSTKVCPDQVFRFLLLTNSSHFIILHNHPSGTCHASKDDERVTVRLIQCAKLMGLTLLDHIIVTHDSHYSIRKNTALFEIT